MSPAASGLVKAKKYDIKDSNIALLGSDIEKNVRLNAAKTEDAWKSAGSQLGLQIWRIENFKVVSWPKDHYGKFFSGDSYIILRTYKKKDDDKKFSYDLHFWLGRETSQDEAGTAAYKTVELDDFLGTTPVQFREIQGYESEHFLSYFPKFECVDGGVDSGFKHVEPEKYRPRLLQVKGIKKSVVVREVEKTYKSLNLGDVFILDCGLDVYQFNGSQSNGMERIKAAEFVQALESERYGKTKVHVVEDSDSSAELKSFWDALGDKGPIKSAGEGGPDAGAKAEKKLFRLSDASGKIEFKEESSGTIKYSKLDTKDVFIFDAGNTVFVWIGKGASVGEKKNALQYAQDYLHKFNRPPHIPIAKVLEGGENDLFNESFDK